MWAKESEAGGRAEWVFVLVCWGGHHDMPQAGGGGNSRVCFFGRSKVGVGLCCSMTWCRLGVREQLGTSVLGQVGGRAMPAQQA